jgi:arsenite/tail-anchored protein-transporting ATPase
MTGIDAVLASLPPWTLVGGKGGVGKTTCAAALGLHSAQRGCTTLVLSTDPAGALGDVVGAALTGEPRAIDGVPGLFASQLDANAARTAFLREWGDVLGTIIDRGTYLDREDIDGLVAAAMPGVDETMALLALADLADRGTWARVFLDTAPTGHTLRLLALPQTFRAIVDLLDTMQAKHRFMVSALLHRYRADEADEFIADLRRKVERLRSLLTDGNHTGVVLVTRPEPVVAAETERYAAALAERGLHVRVVLVNAVPPRRVGDAAEVAERVRGVARGARVFMVPEIRGLGGGLGGIARWADGVRHPRPRRASATVAARAPTETPTVGRDLASLPAAGNLVDSLPPVLIVGGKGGVGKTSVSCALALAAARSGATTFLVSTDPAPSIADALAEPVGSSDCVVAGGFGLVARQMDASAEFTRWREQYRARVDAAFDALLGPGVDAQHDRAVARDLLALAPPGIDELYALVWLGDALAQRTYERLVVDPAPTGHLVRLLEMPALALDWAHRLLRLMLKYRGLAGGGETSSELLTFARRTRAVNELLRDPARCGVLVVALDEPIVRLESARVVDRVRALGNHVPAIVWNRVTRAPLPLPVEGTLGQFVAPEVAPPPLGPAGLLDWLDGWRALARDV